MTLAIGREQARKLVHIAFGFCAFLLAWLPTPAAAVMAVAAFLFNFYLLPRLSGGFISRQEKGSDAGILLYPLSVLALILCFPSRPEIAAAVWGILAFGDGFATLIGTALPRPPLPWNREKSVSGSVAFLLFGSAGALALFLFVSDNRTLLSPIVIVSVTTLLCAIVESSKTGIDDNVTVPLTGGLVMVALCTLRLVPHAQIDRAVIIFLIANVLLAAVGYAARSVSVSGMAGGALLGTILILFGGWQLYLVLLLFFVIGSGVTKLGYRRKQRLGLAQESGGRRGFSHAFANVGVAALVALLIRSSQLPEAVLFLSAVASLATAAADTTGSEIGQWLGRRTFLPLSFRPVQAGTEGAVSFEGTAAGAAAAFVVSLIGVILLQRSPFAAPPALFWPAVMVVTMSAFAGSYLESVLGSLNRRRGAPIPNGVMNFINTMIGAALALVVMRNLMQ